MQLKVIWVQDDLFNKIIQGKYLRERNFLTFVQNFFQMLSSLYLFLEGSLVTWTSLRLIHFRSDLAALAMPLLPSELQRILNKPFKKQRIPAGALVITDSDSNPEPEQEDFGAPRLSEPQSLRDGSQCFGTQPQLG